MIYTNRLLSFFFSIFMAAFVYGGISLAKKGKAVKIRPIAGLAALEEAVGRATELGKPVHYSTGSGDLVSEMAPQTLASLDILLQVSKLCAKYDCQIIVTNRNAVLHSVAEAVVAQAYLEEGAPEKIQPDMVRFLSDNQFAAAAQALGIMQREQVAANVMFGPFYAESLLLAEAASSVGAVQIAGTTRMYQLPFFVACCDYTLLGDEMFAAGALYSQDTVRLGSIWAQDMVKMTLIGLIVLGVLAATAGNTWLGDMLANYGG